MVNKFKYLPFLNGIYSTAPGITPTNKNAKKEDRQILQIDDQYMEYLYNKKKCREEDIHKYYLEENLNHKTIKLVNDYVLNLLVTDYAEFFVRLDDTRLLNKINNEVIVLDGDGIKVKSNIYHSTFDALASQIQEDLAVFQLGKMKDYLTAIHLCSPNHWSPGEKIGKPFDDIHKPIPGMDATNDNYQKILNTIVRKRGPFTRFAWGLGTDDRLNHHPAPTPGKQSKLWQGRDPSASDTSIFVRVERQNLVGFPEVNAFLFTIRTFFYNVASLTQHEKTQLWHAVKSMSPASLQYKGLNGWAEQLRGRLIAD